MTLEFLPFPPSSSDEHPIPIDAPVALTVWHNHKKMLTMSGYFMGKRWYVKQLQGAAGVNIPRDLEWTTRFVAACQALVLAGKLKEVRLPHARDLFPYNKPVVRASDGQSVEQVRSQIQKRMLRHYDQTAQRHGFLAQGRWTVWRGSADDSQRGDSSPRKSY